MYKIELYHFKPSYRNGDLEEATELISTKVMKLKKEAKSWVLWQVNGKNYKEEWNTGKKSSKVYWFTGKTWTNENNGETREEYYSYIITKE